jgi:hypothetical protein
MTTNHESNQPDDDLDPYLWDKSGVADPEIARLEGLLARYRHDQPLRPMLAPSATWLQRIRGWRWISAATVAAILIVAAAIYLDVQNRLQWKTGNPWKVVKLAGTPKINGEDSDSWGQLPLGQMLQTDGVSRAELHVGRIGVVEVQPNTTVRLLETRSGRHRMELVEGAISARTWAPPFSFAVETRSATAFDLGCAFTLEAHHDGSGVVRVTSGWVQFAFDDIQALVPAGAEAVTREGLGPGTPYFSDTSAAFKAALAQFDLSRVDDAARALALNGVLVAAGKRDAISLLNVFRKVSPEQRGLVFDRLAVLSPPPPGVTREAVVAGSVQALDPWWAQVEAETGVGDPKSWLGNWKDSLKKF